MRRVVARLLVLTFGLAGCAGESTLVFEQGSGIDVALVGGDGAGPFEAAAHELGLDAGTSGDGPHDAQSTDQRADAHPIDAAKPDTTVDTLAPDTTVDTLAHDTTVDTAPPLGPLTLVGGAPAAVAGCANALEPAISHDGLTLHSRVAGSTNGQRTTRPSVGGAFTSCQSSALTNMEDPTFFFHQGKERMIISRGPAPRTLYYCTAVDVSTCSVIEILDIGGGAIALDFDGPNVADGVNPPQMVFNVGSVIYLAEPVQANLNQWQIREVLPITGGDPAISDDGQVVVYETKPNTVSQINAIYRGANGGWIGAHHLSALDATDGIFEPDIHTLGGHVRPTYEIFYREGTTLYHATFER